MRCDGIQHARPEAISGVGTPHFESQLKGSKAVVIQCQPRVEQNRIHLFKSCLRRGIHSTQYNGSWPEFSPLLNKSRNPGCIPRDQRQWAKTEADQPIELSDATCCNYAYLRIGLQ